MAKTGTEKKSCGCSKKNYTSIGGQALLEGILMRGPNADCIAVRLPDGSIDTKVTETGGKKRVWKKIPVLRGIIAFIQSLVTGYKALMYSAEKSGEVTSEEEMSKFDKWLSERLGDGVMTAIGVVSLMLGLFLSLLLFKFLPMAAVSGIEMLGVKIESDILKSVIEGVIKLAIFVGYLAAVSLMKDIRVTFMYHGAEHKTISCYEAGEELTPENAARFPREHPRCGTSFLFLMVALGIAVNCFLTWSSVWLRLFSSLLALPVVMGLGYEILKLCGKYDNILTRAVSAPGKWMQKLTTREPNEKQLEVAIAALKAVIPGDGSDRISLK